VAACDDSDDEVESEVGQSVATVEATEVATEVAELATETAEPTDEPMASVTEVVTVEPTDDATPPATPDATEDVTPQVTQPVTPDATESVAAEDVTPEATDSLLPSVNNVSLSGEFIIAVSTTLDGNLPESVRAPLEGQRWVIVNATIFNDSSQPLLIDPLNVFLTDQQDNRYPLDSAEVDIQPPLIGETIPAGESRRGMMQFSIDEDAMPTEIGWCLDDECQEILRSPLP